MKFMSGRLSSPLLSLSGHPPHARITSLPASFTPPVGLLSPDDGESPHQPFASVSERKQNFSSVVAAGCALSGTFLLRACMDQRRLTGKFASALDTRRRVARRLARAAARLQYGNLAQATGGSAPYVAASPAALSCRKWAENVILLADVLFDVTPRRRVAYLPHKARPTFRIFAGDSNYENRTARPDRSAFVNGEREGFRLATFQLGSRLSECDPERDSTPGRAKPGIRTLPSAVSRLSSRLAHMRVKFGAYLSTLCAPYFQPRLSQATGPSKLLSTPASQFAISLVTRCIEVDSSGLALSVAPRTITYLGLFYARRATALSSQCHNNPQIRSNSSRAIRSSNHS